MKPRVIAIVMFVLAGCSATSEVPVDTSGSPAPSSSAVAPGNGTLYSTLWSSSEPSVTITGYPIGADGNLGAPTEVLSGPASDTTFPAVVDGRGPLALTGTFTNYWTTEVQLHSDGRVIGKVAAPRWCGGEGLSYNDCVLLDEARVARTTELGRDPMTGDGPAEGSITVSSLADGSTMDEFGPFPDLTGMLGTSSPDELLLVTSPAVSDAGPSVPTTVLRLDVSDGSITEIGQSPPGWSPLCAIGTDSVLGFPSDGLTGSAVVVGPAQVADVTWEQQDLPEGCSADGAFLYLIGMPPQTTEETAATATSIAQTTVERISLADGSRSEVLVLPAAEYARPITR